MKIRVVVFLLLISFASTLSAVTYQCSPAAGGKITHSGKNTTATPNSGYTFSKWSIKINSQSPTYSTKNPDDFSSYELLEAMEYASVTITANFTAVTTYTITWKNWDGTTLTTSKVTKGNTPSYTGATPTRPSTAQYAYTFSGWTPTIVAASANATYTATYTSTPRYTVSFNANGGIIPVDGNMGNTPAGHITTLNGSQTIGSVVVTKGKTDFRTMSNDCPSRDYYSFLGWYTATTGGEQVYNSSGSYVAGTYWDTDGKWKGTTDVQLYAQWLANTYTITWKQDDGTTIDETLVEYNQLPAHDSPTKPATAEWTYSFASWTPTITAVTGNATYTAKYDSIPNCPKNGTCGANLTWELSCDSVLTISGTGAMTNFSTDAPWYSYRQAIKSISLPDGLTTIGFTAFYGCSRITEITIPNSVTSIGGDAFYGCSNLSSVTLPNSITSINVEVFCGCSKLTKITIPNSVTNIAYAAFRACGLKSLVIPSSVTNIGDIAFRSCDMDYVKIEAATPPSIGTEAFGGEDPPYESTYPIYVPCGAVDTYKAAWSYYSERIQSQPIPSGTCGANLTWELSCDSVLTISGTGAMTNYASYSNVPWYPNHSSIKSVIISDGVTSIGHNAFRGCSSLTSVTIGNSVTSIGSYAFYNCSGLTSITIPSSVTSIWSSAFSHCSGLTSITIPNSVTSIGYQAFAYCSSLSSIDIPNSVTSLGSYAFYECSGLISANIPSSETNISDAVFYNCSSLTSITIPNSITSIGEWAFYGCAGLTSIIIPNTVTSIGQHAFDYCSGLTSIDIPSNVTIIERYTFKDCSSLLSVTIPNSVTSIGQSAFSGCSGLTSVTIPNSITSIGNTAFYGCSGLTSIAVDATTPPSLGNSAFNNTNNCSIYVPCGTLDAYKSAWSGYSSRISNHPIASGTCGASGDNLTWELSCDSVLTISGTGAMEHYTIVGSAPWYYYRETIKSISLPDGLTRIGSRAFEDCSSATSVTIPNSVTTISNDAFYNCTGLTSITIPNSVASIENQAFENCTGLTLITIYAAMPPFGGGGAFDNTNNCPIYVPCGSVELYKSVWSGYASRININNQPIASGTCGASGDNLTWELSCDSVLTISGAGAMSNYASYSNVPWYSNRVSIKSVIILDGVTSIGNFAFNQCIRLTYVGIPNSVTGIGNSAFALCSRLTSITIPNSVTGIGNSAFSHCSGLTSVTIEAETPPALGNGAFTNTNNCPIYVPCGSVESYKSAWPDYASRIKNQPIASGTCGASGDNLTWELSCDSVLTISGSGAMEVYASYTSVPWNYYRQYIKHISLPDGITTVRSFNDCSNLVSVTIPSSVTIIGYSAFSGCTNMSFIKIDAENPPSGNYAFDNTNNCPIYVPCGSVESYKSVWSNYSSRIQGYGTFTITVESDDENQGTTTVTKP